MDPEYLENAKKRGQPAEIPCTFMRGGTSRGCYFLRSDLPAEQTALDAVILGVYGSPDQRQINGMGGGDPLTSKVAVVAPSSRADADVDFTFGQVGIDTPQVFWVGNCGNMSSGVGPFAIERGLVPAAEPVTTVRIYNTNTDKIITARVPVAAGRVVEDGDVAIAGVPGTGAGILLDFGDCGGAVTGTTLPLGEPRTTMTLSDGRTAEISIVDAATPFVFVRADDVGMSGTESAAEIDSDSALLERVEEVRAFAARAIGLVTPEQVAREVSPSIPRVSVVSTPTDYTAADGTPVSGGAVELVARQLAMQRTHKTYAVTGTLCTSVAAAIPGTVVNEVAKVPEPGGLFRIGHPGGVIAARVRVAFPDGPDGDINSVRIEEASLLRTARVLMTGRVRVPQS